MDPVTTQVVISRPPEEVFAYLADVANHPEFLDHFTSGWHLTREDSYGQGAGARFTLEQRMNRFPWMDLTVLECEAPSRLVLAGRAGKYNRVRAVCSYELEPASGGATQVTLTFETQTRLPSDRLADRRGFHKRQWARALRRVRTILEEDLDRGARATIAGGARKPATNTPLR
jgi:uncharacterized protein YndB with AHSA1/START domain